MFKFPHDFLKELDFVVSKITTLVSEHLPGGWESWKDARLYGEFDWYCNCEKYDHSDDYYDYEAYYSQEHPGITLRDYLKTFYEKFEKRVKISNFKGALKLIWKLIELCKKAMDTYEYEDMKKFNTEKLILKGSNKECEMKYTLCKGTMYTLCEALRITAVALYPFVPETAYKIGDLLGTIIDDDVAKDEAKEYGILPINTKVKKMKRYLIYPK